MLSPALIAALPAVLAAGKGAAVAGAAGAGAGGAAGGGFLTSILPLLKQFGGQVAGQAISKIGQGEQQQPMQQLQLLQPIQTPQMQMQQPRGRGFLGGMGRGY